MLELIELKKKLIETNIDISFNEMLGFHYEHQAISSAILSQCDCYGGHCITDGVVLFMWNYFFH
jgi:hypothetical protein